MQENDIAKIIMNESFAIHRALGPGLLESVYETILARKLHAAGLTVQRQVPVAITYEDLYFDEGFRADIIVNNKVIIELKSVEQMRPVYTKQLLTYLRLKGCKLGLLINFGESFLKDGFKRIANGL